MDDQRRNVLVERKVLDVDRSAAAGHVELLVDGVHLLAKDVDLLVGERLEDVLQEIHLVVKRLHLEMSQDDMRKILTEPVRVYLCQFRSASESAGVSFEVLMFMFHRAGEVRAPSEDRSHYLWRQAMHQAGRLETSESGFRISQSICTKMKVSPGDGWI